MNYNTEIVLNPAYQSSDFEINPLNIGIELDFNLIDFSIEVLVGSNIVIGTNEHIPKILYQPTPPINPSLNDIWVSSTTLIQYQWIGAWVNFNLQ